MKRKSFLRIFDKFEDFVRGHLSRIPIFYAFLGGVSIVLFWRGIWHTADMVVPYFFRNATDEVFQKAVIWDGPVTILISAILLLSTGLVVSSFIGTNIIISGIKNEKKLEEKEAEEIETEEYILHTLKTEVKKIREDLEVIKSKVNK
jgi:hypothetical protein